MGVSSLSRRDLITVYRLLRDVLGGAPHPTVLRGPEEMTVNQLRGSVAVLRNVCKIPRKIRQ